MPKIVLQNKTIIEENKYENKYENIEKKKKRNFRSSY
jgi:hypothetical protein